MTKVIDYFDAPPHEWLSNFYPCVVYWEGELWPTTEHAYQAAKTLDKGHRERIRTAKSPGHAKQLGQKDAFKHHGVAMRHDWETVKYDIMIDLLRLKFRTSRLRELLLSTGDAKLVEGNTWNDTCWGVCDGEGANNLGRSLMLVRAELQVEAGGEKRRNWAHALDVAASTFLTLSEPQSHALKELASAIKEDRP